MEWTMKLSFWSDENRWFVPRALGLGYSLNLKYVAKRIGLIKPEEAAPPSEEAATSGQTMATESREERLRRQIEASRFEDKP